MSDDMDRIETQLHEEKQALIHANNLLRSEIAHNDAQITTIRIKLASLRMDKPLSGGMAEKAEGVK